MSWGEDVVIVYKEIDARYHKACQLMICEQQIDVAIIEAEKEWENGGKLLDARDALAGLWRKYDK